MSDSQQPEGNDPDDLVQVLLDRIALQADADHQHIHLTERHGSRGFSIVIGTVEASEIQRVVAGVEAERPLTHRLMHETLTACDVRLVGVDIVRLDNGTFFAELRLARPDTAQEVEVDARPSDAIALAMRAKAPIRVANRVLDAADADV